MTLILHVGFPKTATTALQRMFFDNADKLRMLGLYYPIVDQDFKQRYLKALLVKKSGVKGSIASRDQAKLDKLREAVVNSEDKAILLSCEELTNELDFRLDRYSLAPLASYLTSLGRDIRIIIYVRNPIEYYLSRMQESLKSKAGIVPPDDFDARLSWTISNYEAAFGTRAQVRSFGRGVLVSNSIATDFFETISETISIKDASLREPNVNESLSAEVMFALEFLRCYSEKAGTGVTHNADTSRFLWRNLQQIDAKLGSSGKPMLYACAARKLLATAQADMDAVSADYGLTFAEHGALKEENPLPPEAWITSVEQIVPVDRARAFSLISILAGRGVKALAAAS